ncbi:MAG: DUF480 domain-containing protein [Planctomycetes bacterium]|nr:DUF480 domain-containing protein [Planctomycetota bacterium]
MLDRTEQRIVGVLIEKERTVPDTYPMSENALIDGCNQKSNREPCMELRQFQVAGTLMSLMEKGWIARIDGGSRVIKYRHKVVEQLGLSSSELAILAELLLRGPQAPGALKPRVARMGFFSDPEQIESVLRAMARRPQPVVAQLLMAPRERDRRWRHLLGDGSEVAASGETEANVNPATLALPALHKTPATPATPAAPATPATPAAPAAPALGQIEIALRVTRLEAEVALLKAALIKLALI